MDQLPAIRSDVLSFLCSLLLLLLDVQLFLGDSCWERERSRGRGQSPFHNSVWKRSDDGSRPASMNFFHCELDICLQIDNVQQFFQNSKKQLSKSRERDVSLATQTRTNQAQITALQQTLKHVNVSWIQFTQTMKVCVEISSLRSTK